MFNQLNIINKIRRISKLHAPEIPIMKNNDFINSVHSHPNIYSASEYLKNKLFFVVLNDGKYAPKTTVDIDFFSIENELIYCNYFDDFGPLNLACLYKYCWKLNKKLKHPKNIRKQIVHYTIRDDKKVANAAYLIASYAVLYLNKNPQDACKPLFDECLILKPFRDATSGISHYNIRLQDCLNALLKAATFRFFDFDDFNVTEYERYEKFENGDLNWIVPQKFLAFTGPSSQSNNYHPPEHYFEYFLRNNVVAVIRLNRECYDASKFEKIGINHYDMFLPDGTAPSRSILNQFLKISETTDGAIAVHCKAGLGRTGSLICAYLIKHYNMTAKEAIAWARICRPGSVIGHQQAWLETIQKELWHMGQQYRLKNYGDINLIIRHKRGIYSIAEKLDIKNSQSSRCHLKHKVDSLEDDEDNKIIQQTCPGLNKWKKFQTSHESSSTSHCPESRNLNSNFRLINHSDTNIIQNCTSSRLGILSQGDHLNRIKMQRNFPIKKSLMRN